ncbi:MAG: TlpA disulfide reductase family protein [Gelidibacter sp.]
MKQLSVIILVFLFLSCNRDTSQKMPHGMYLGQLTINDQEELPFNFEVTADKALKIFNADEVILVNDITYKNDSVYIKIPVFEGFIVVKLTEDGMVGSFFNEDFGSRLSFKAFYNSNARFKLTAPAATDVSGNWEVMFSADSDENTYLAKGVFEQKGQKLTGTFQTKTGDYRYLEGVVNGNQLKLSTFDGSHAYLFVATVTDSTMKGTFFSGNTYAEPFEAKRNDLFELPDANALTFLKEGYERLEFSFPKSDSTMVSLNDAQFKDKVVVVQIMGTWCPNCLDETKYFSEYYNNNSQKDIEFVALAFEYAKTEEKAFKSIAELKNRIGIEYPIVLAQYGTSNKAEAQKKLPMLNHILSYPTTIYIDKTGKVRKIHTGFSGPATGEAYVDFKNEFESFMEELLAE